MSDRYDRLVEEIRLLRDLAELTMERSRVLVEQTKRITEQAKRVGSLDRNPKRKPPSK